ncbi:TPA: coproporphyrinogen III oxidase, partial [Campylobacter lari]|nr:coproporphyrinogen III oxidase [Campylobacter lari]
KKENNTLYTSEFGRYLFMVLMKDFYTGMDLVRAVFRDDKRLQDKERINIMQENVDPLDFKSMEFKG